MVQNAKHKLQQLELGSQKKATNQAAQLSLPIVDNIADNIADNIVENKVNPTLILLAETDPDELTPKQALALIYQLKESLG